MRELAGITQRVRQETRIGQLIVDRVVGVAVHPQRRREALQNAGRRVTRESGRKQIAFPASRQAARRRRVVRNDHRRPITGGE